MKRYNDKIKPPEEEKTMSIDEELAELSELCKHGVEDIELYKKIRDNVLKEIKIDQLAATIILTDLIKIRSKRKHTFDRLVYFICNSHKSYQQLGKQLGCSGQTMFSLVKYHSRQIRWLDNLKKIKGKEDGKRKFY